MSADPAAGVAAADAAPGMEAAGPAAGVAAADAAAGAAAADPGADAAPGVAPEPTPGVPAEAGPDPTPEATPEAAPEPTPEQVMLTTAALTVFRLNGQFLGVAEELSRPAGLTAARWQVLGAVLREPLPVAGVARAMGITRQAVQRIADVLVGLGLAEYRPNPAHRRAKLLAATDAGYAAVRRISPGHARFSTALAAELGPATEDVVDALVRLAAALDAIAPDASAG